MDRIFVKPEPGKRVTDPVKMKPLPIEGAWVNRSPFWLTRIKDKDVSLSKPPTKTETKKLLLEEKE